MAADGPGDSSESGHGRKTWQRVESRSAGGRQSEEKRGRGSEPRKRSKRRRNASNTRGESGESAAGREGGVVHTAASVRRGLVTICRRLIVGVNSEAENRVLVDGRSKGQGVQLEACMRRKQVRREASHCAAPQTQPPRPATSCLLQMLHRKRPSRIPKCPVCPSCGQ